MERPCYLDVNRDAIGDGLRELSKNHLNFAIKMMSMYGNYDSARQAIDRYTSTIQMAKRRGVDNLKNIEEKANEIINFLEENKA